jgi:hypothetical protein
MTQSQLETFEVAALRFDLERLKQDLEKIKTQEITETPWKYLKGVLCGYSPTEIANECVVKDKTVQVALNREFKTLLETLLGKELGRINWGSIPKWLAEAGYEIQSYKQQPVNLTRHTFQAMLDEQRKLTSSPLINKPGKKFNHPDMYVPLGVVERINKEPKRSEDEGFPLQGSQLYREKEEVTPIEHNQFFEQLRKGETANSNGRRIAITGEPGAGKTTQLQKIADWVHGETEDMVVWVSLADLGEKSLEDYLLQVWLRDALSLKSGGVTDAMENALVERFKDGEVWLLLDGVDEMGVNNPLFEIRNQLRGWIASASVVLTCRLNVWDMGKNYLITDFDVYRNLDFSEPQQQEFITKYFKDNPQLGKDLEAELEKSGKERIRDLVRNPLRLTLLCSSWERYRGGLPETKAGLYESFVNTFYEWKEEQFPTTSAQRKELNKALGELAKQAIDQPSSRFRLTQHQVCEVLGEIDEPLFKLATDIGWLNKVGVAEENPDEPVYAFFHATFQEYFAALAIEAWSYLLHHIPNYPEKGEYRIFEPQWEQVFLLWLGRKDITITSKDSILELLLYFEVFGKQEQILGLILYCYRALFIASLGVIEIPQCRVSRKVIEKLVEVAFGYIESATQTWCYDIPFLQPEAEELLYFMPQDLTIEVLLDLLKGRHMQIYYDDVSLFIHEISPQNPELVNLLSSLLSFKSNINSLEYIYYKEFLVGVAEVLHYIDPNHVKANKFLEDYYIPESERQFSKGIPPVYLKQNPSNSLDNNNYTQKLLNEHIDTDDPVQKLKFSLKRKPGDPKTILALIREIQHGRRSIYIGQAISLVVNEVTKFQYLLPLLVQSLQEDVNAANFMTYNLLWCCVQNMSYPDFYKAWHSQPATTHPEATDITPVGDTSTTQTLNQQLTDLASQLQPTATAYPVVLDLGTLKGETEQSAIAQKFCNLLYSANVFPETINLPPEVNNAFQLERYFFGIKRHLNRENIVLLLQNQQPYPELVDFCCQLSSDTVKIAWITDQPLDIPLRGFPPQPNLATVVQNWINELGCGDDKVARKLTE